MKKIITSFLMIALLVITPIVSAWSTYEGPDNNYASVRDYQKQDQTLVKHIIKVVEPIKEWFKGSNDKPKNPNYFNKVSQQDIITNPDPKPIEETGETRCGEEKRTRVHMPTTVAKVLKERPGKKMIPLEPEPVKERPIKRYPKIEEPPQYDGDEGAGGGGHPCDPSYTHDDLVFRDIEVTIDVNVMDDYVGITHTMGNRGQDEMTFDVRVVLARYDQQTREWEIIHEHQYTETLPPGVGTGAGAVHTLEEGYYATYIQLVFHRDDIEINDFDHEIFTVN